MILPLCKVSVDRRVDFWVPSIAIMNNWLTTAIVASALDLRVFDYTKVLVDVVVTDEKNICQLNHEYRNIAKPTNILSFNLDTNINDSEYLIGSLVICAAIITRQAKNNCIPLIVHWAHILVHGTLHLLGYDHVADKEFHLMLGQEKLVLSKLGFENNITDDNAV